MKNLTYVTLIGLGLAVASPVFAGAEDDPLLTKVTIDQLEYRSGKDESPWVLEADAWVGKDLHKLWFKTEVERVDGETHEAELQVLYSRAFDPYWNFHLGARRDFEPKPNRNWGVLGVNGTAPYYIETDLSLFVGEDGRAAVRLELEKEVMITQRWVLIPELELNAYSKADEELGVGAGLVNAEIGLRLAYEIRREFAPYIGVTWSSQFGETADMADDEGEDTSATHLVVGIHAWF